MKTKREYFDDICDSLRNGQRKQAFRQMEGLCRYDLADMLDYFARDLEDTELALDAAKTYFRIVGR